MQFQIELFDASQRYSNMNPKYPSKIFRKRVDLRKKGFDYMQPGFYAITICAADQTSIFGGFLGDKFQLSEIGQIVHDEWLLIPTRRPLVRVDAFQMMPNHLHGIIELRGHDTELGSLIRTFKGATTKLIRKEFPYIEEVFQRNFWDDIIRTPEQLENWRTYIKRNPDKWAAEIKRATQRTW